MFGLIKIVYRKFIYTPISYIINFWHDLTNILNDQPVVIEYDSDIEMGYWDINNAETQTTLITTRNAFTQTENNGYLYVSNINYDSDFDL